MPISLVLDIIISALLVLTIAYAVRLNQRLSQLRADKNELLQLAKTFAEATVRAEAGIQNLKISSEALRAEVNKAKALKDDLSYLVERGGRAADDMVANVRAPRSAASSEPSVGVGLGGNRPVGRDKGVAPSRRSDADTRLIEDAIRSVTPQNGASDMDLSLDDRAQATRRITGRLAASGASSGKSSGKSSGASSFKASSAKTSDALASRGLGRELGRMVDDNEIEDTQSARELLRALSSVK